MEQTLSTLSNNKNNNYKVTFKKIFRASLAELQVHKKLFIITLVLHGVAMLLFIFNTSFYASSYDREAVMNGSGWGSVFSIFGALTCFFAAINVFRDTNNQQLCDIAMALPIKAVERFFSKLLCLAYMQILPLTVSFLGGNGIAYLVGKIQWGAIEREAGESIFAFYLMILAGVMFVMAITTLCSCCCGTLAESSYFSILLIGIANLLPIGFLSGIVSSSGFRTWDLSAMPIDLRYFGLLCLNISDYRDFADITLHAGVSCLISLAIMLAGVFIYIKRDAKTVGTPIASRVFFEIIMASGCLTLFFLGWLGAFMGWSILIAGTAYVIINIIVSRAKIKITSVLAWAGKFALTLAVFLGVSAGCIKTRGFGYYKTLPEEPYMEGAKFTINLNNYNGYSFNGHYYYGDDRYYKKFYSSPLTPEQASELMSIIHKHEKQSLAEINPFDDLFDRICYFENNAFVSISANSDVKFGRYPQPHNQFERSIVYSKTTGKRMTEYNWKYSREIYMTPSQAQALYEELKALDYLMNNKPGQDTPITIPAYSN